MTDRERIVELGHAGFSKDTIAAILGITVAEVSQLRRGREGDVPGDSRSYHLGIEVFDAGLEPVVLDTASLYVPEGGILEVSYFAMFVPVGGEPGTDYGWLLDLDGDGACETDTDPDKNTISNNGTADTVEDLEDPELVWTAISTTINGANLLDGTGSSVAQIPPAPGRRAFRGGAGDAVASLYVDAGTHTVEALLIPGDAAMAVAERRLSLAYR